MAQDWARPSARYTPRLIAAIKRHYEDGDELMRDIAYAYGISLRTLHRMADRYGWRKRGDRPPKDLEASQLLLLASEALRQGQYEKYDVLMRECREMQRAREENQSS